MTRFTVPLAIILASCTGCGAELSSNDAESPEAVPLGTAFDRTSSGRVVGRVTWSGSIPDPPGFLYGVPRADGAGFEFKTARNPNRPRIDRESRAVAGAVVYLRGIRPERSRPWDLPPVSVEMGDGQITVVQGEFRGRSGFVRCGASITVRSTESRYHVLRGRGDAFFGLTLPDADRAVSRVLNRPGHVELSSGTGMYWARADLFVAEHPYFTHTDKDGRFTFEAVPTGAVEVVVWLPGWQPAKQERDPDSTQVARQTYAAPIERIATVQVGPVGGVEVGVKVP